MTGTAAGDLFANVAPAAGGPAPAEGVLAALPTAGERRDTWYKGRVLSHSSITTYLSCPLKWKFRYIDRIPERPRSFFSFGKSVHAGLEFLFSRIVDGFPTLESLLAHYRTSWLREGYETAAQERWFFHEGERILRGFYAKHQAEVAQVVQVEFKFTVDIDGVPVMGFVDRVDRAPGGGLAIIDYKTGKAIDKTRSRTDPQLTLYQMACREALGAGVETVTLYHLNSLTALTAPAHSSAQEDAVRANVHQVASGVSAERFDPKPTDAMTCQWCDYRQICPAMATPRQAEAARAVLTQTAGDLADRLGKLDTKIKALSEERSSLRETLMAHMARSGASRVAGRHFAVTMEKNGDGAAAEWTSEPLVGDNQP